MHLFPWIGHQRKVYAETGVTWHARSEWFRETRGGDELAAGQGEEQKRRCPLQHRQAETKENVGTRKSLKDKNNLMSEMIKTSTDEELNCVPVYQTPSLLDAEH